MNYWLIYAGCSWCLGVVLMLSHNTERKLANAKGQFGLAAVSRVRLFMMLLSPVLLPIVAAMWLFNVAQMFLKMRTMQRFESKHRDPDYLPVNVFHLDPQVQQWFKLQTPEFFSLGFQMVGDFQYRTEPFSIVSRHFLSEDGQVVGSLITMDGSRCAIEMSSIDHKETYIGTCTVGEGMGDPVSSDRIAVNHVDLQPLSGVIEAHRDYLSARDSEALTFGVEHVEAILRYGSRCMSDWKFQQGLLVEPAPAPEMPPALADTSASCC